MKRFFCFLCILMLPLCQVIAQSYDFKIDGKCYTIISKVDGTVRLVAGEENYTGNLIIPGQLEFRGRKFTVTHIGRNVLSATSYDTVVIPNTVVEMEEDARYYYSASHYSEPRGCGHIGYLKFEDAVQPLDIGCRYEGYRETRGMFESCDIDHVYIGRMFRYKYNLHLRENLKKVTIGKNITTITNDMIPLNITSFVIPEQVTSIEESAFSRCSKLTHISGVERMSSIGREAFRDCENLQEIILPKEIGYIPKGLFEGCRSLTNIDIPSDVTYIGDAAFYGCQRLKKVVLPPRMTELSMRTFGACSQLEEVVLPPRLESIGFQCFVFCLALDKLEIPSTVNNISGEAFASCHALQSIVLPEGITNLPDRLFVSCTSLKECTLPSSLTEMGNGVFSECEQLASITIPASVGRIRKSTFSACTGLKVIRMENETPVPLEDGAFQRYHFLDSELQVPVWAKAAYEKAEGWLNFWNITEYNPTGELRLKVTCPENGRVAVGNDTICNDVLVKNFSKAEDVTLTFLPEEGYSVKKVMVNDEDRTDRVKNNVLTLTVDTFLNVIVEFNHSTLVLDDELDTYQSFKTEEVEEVIYRRRFDDTLWQALYLPFSLDYDDWCDQFDIASIHNVHQYDDNHDGKVDRTAIEAFLLKEGSGTDANTPYLIRAKSANMFSLMKRNVTLQPALSSGFDCSSVTTRFYFQGTYDKCSGNIMAGKGYYAMRDGILAPVDPLTTVPGFRWWMQAVSRDGQQWTSPSKIEIDIVDNLVGIDDAVPMTDMEGSRGTDVYNMQGKLVKRGAANLNGLAKGIYIIGGKKIIK